MAPSSQAATREPRILNPWTVANDWAVAYRKYSRAHVADEERERSAGLQIRLGELASAAATQMMPQQEPLKYWPALSSVSPSIIARTASAFCGQRPVAIAIWSRSSATPPLSQQASGLRHLANGSTTTPMANSSKRASCARQRRLQLKASRNTSALG